jgi:hypothetical protein
MALADQIDNLIKKRTKSPTHCAYAVFYNNLSKEDQKALDNAWEKNYPVSVVVAAIRADGHKTSSDAVRLHRNGSCRCPKE